MWIILSLQAPWANAEHNDWDGKWGSHQHYRTSSGNGWRSLCSRPGRHWTQRLISGQLGFRRSNKLYVYFRVLSLIADMVTTATHTHVYIYIYHFLWFDSHLQEQASLLLVDLSSSLLYMDSNKSNENEISNAASTIVEGASNILDYSSSVSHLTSSPCSLG